MPAGGSESEHFEGTFIVNTCGFLLKYRIANYCKKGSGDDGVSQPNIAILVLVVTTVPEGRDGLAPHNEGGGQGNQGQESNESTTAGSDSL